MLLAIPIFVFPLVDDRLIMDDFWPLSSRDNFQTLQFSGCASLKLKISGPCHKLLPLCPWSLFAILIIIFKTYNKKNFIPYLR